VANPISDRGDGAEGLNSTFVFPTSIVPLVARRVDRVWPLGTASVLSSPLDVVVTARHVFDCLDEVLAPLPNGSGVVDLGDIEVFLLWPTSLQQPNFRHAGRTTGASIRRHSDLALISFDRDDVVPEVAAEIRGFPISTHRPEPGAKCTAMGFPGMAVSARSLTEATGSLPWRVSRGLILDVFPERRDQSGPFAWLPCRN
jgi:hypothetical protein